MVSATEVRVRFHAPPARVALADPRAPLRRAEIAAVGPSRSLAEHEQVPSAVPAPPPPPAPGPDPAEERIARRLEEDRAAIAKLLDNVRAGVQRIEEAHAKRLGEWRHAAVELAVTIAARLVHDRVKADDFAIEAVVREATELLNARGPITVRLHPADLALMESRLAGAPLFADSAGMVVVAADATQSRGNCLVETGDTSVTARLGDQLETMRRELLRSLGDAESRS